MKTLRTALLLSIAVSLQPLPLYSQQLDSEQPSTAGIEFFEAKVRPVLVKRCYDCHSSQAGVAEAELRLDSLASIRAGGTRGPAVVPQKPEASLLLAAVMHLESDLKMPPKEEKLSSEIISDLRKWIEMGAPDPRTDGSFNTQSTEQRYQAAQDHWAYQPLQRAAPPAVSKLDWARDEVDRFILAKLEQSGLAPARDAAPNVLLRRLSFSLVGLPPTPEVLERFVAACETEGVDSALASVVDDLLESKQFGERWGRHWLDLARFGESSGGESNVSFPYAWRYRDYVLDSVNADIPYDRFLAEQIAGDLLPADSNAERARLLTATGFLALGTKNLGENNDEKFEADVVDEQIDSLSRSVLASTLACARCHHHKFDPFTMQDYYGLAGIFASTKTYFGTFTSPANNRGGDPLPLPRVAGEKIFHQSLSAKKFAELKQTARELDAERQAIEAAQQAAFAGKQPEKQFTLREVLANLWRRGPVEGKLEILDDQGQAIPVAMGVLDREEIRDIPLLFRGEIGRAGEIVPRAFPSALAINTELEIPKNQSGRRELAQWLTNPHHPLTSRVFVNRVWRHIFGAGLVATVDNFGTTGDMPSHPELLDTLAIEFVEDGWSLKRLVRRLVLSRTWQQASAYDAASFRSDPENRLLWRMPKQRLEAEAIRDAMLAVTGELNQSPVEGSLVATVIGDRPISLIGLDKRLPADLDGSLHRSVYLPVIRDRLPDVLELFDFAEPSLVTGNRDRTNVPVQALYLMNSSFVLARAESLASRLLQKTNSMEGRITAGFQLCFAREPRPDEMQRALEFLKQQQPVGEETLADSLLLASFCQALLATAEFRNLD